MRPDNILLLILAMSIAIFPGIAFFYKWKFGWDYKRKKQKIAEFIEKSADEQIKAKDGPI